MERAAYYFFIFLCNYCILFKFHLLFVWGYNEDYCPLEFNAACLDRYVSTSRTEVLSSSSGQTIALKMKTIRSIDRSCLSTERSDFTPRNIAIFPYWLLPKQ